MCRGRGGGGWRHTCAGGGEGEAGKGQGGRHTCAGGGEGRGKAYMCRERGGGGRLVPSHRVYVCSWREHKREGVRTCAFPLHLYPLSLNSFPSKIKTTGYESRGGSEDVEDSK